MKINKQLISFTVLAIVMSLALPQIGSAKGVRRLPLDMRASVFSVDAVTEEKTTPAEIPLKIQIPETSEEVEKPISCQVEMPANPVYEGQFVAVRKKGVVAKGELFETIAYVKNTGNTPWFSSNSGCPHLITNLGTDKQKDRESQLFTEDLFWESNWLGKNRIAMETKRVDPSELAVFRFWSRAPLEDLYLREYFTPVIEGVTWLDNGRFHMDTRIGNAFLDLDKKDMLKYIEYSGDLSTIDFEGEKSINVSISQQKMLLKIGEIVIREFPVSTGTTRTPTPLGTTKILNKQEVRVAGGWPHYIMPKWLGFRAGGYGIHALPSLANDNGIFWREALNHIGSRRSHGCIRLLPGDAEFAYNFTNVGTTVNVVW